MGPVDMIVRGAAQRPQAHAFGEPRYWLTFWLTDGTTLGRPYFVETRELMGGVILPKESPILERYLGSEGNALRVGLLQEARSSARARRRASLPGAASRPSPIA